MGTGAFGRALRPHEVKEPAMHAVFWTYLLGIAAGLAFFLAMAFRAA